MPLNKSQKKKIIEDLKEKITKQKIFFFVDLKGLKVKDLSNLKKRLKKVDSQIKVSKKTLLRLALKEKGIELDTKKLEGEIASVFGFKDEILPAKTTYQFSLENKNLKILGGYFSGKIMGAEEIKSFAQLPTKEELLGRLVGSISAPVSNLVYVLNANTKGLIYALSAIKK
jgi:large subunit ribosomal protein L10